MIVWMASYPRSGNHLLQKTIESMYHVAPRTVYRAEGRYDYRRLGDTPGETIFLKTHETEDHCHGNEWPAIVLVRDGRAAVARFAHLRQRRKYESSPVEEIMRDLAYEGGWNRFYDRWTRRSGPTVILRFEDMVADLASAVDTAVRGLGLDLPIHHPCTLPVVRPAEDVLQGAVGQMPPDVEKVFWNCNGEMMRRLRYTRNQPWAREEDVA